MNEYSHKFVGSLYFLSLKNSHLLSINLYYPMRRYHCASTTRTSNPVTTVNAWFYCGLDHFEYLTSKTHSSKIVPHKLSRSKCQYSVSTQPFLYQQEQ